MQRRATRLLVSLSLLCCAGPIALSGSAPNSALRDPGPHPPVLGAPRRLQAKGSVCALAFSPDGKWLAVGGNSTELWSTADWKGKSLLPDLTGYVGCLEFGADGTHLFAGTWDSDGPPGTLSLWDVSKKRLLKRTPKQQYSVWSLGVEASSRRVIASTGWEDGSAGEVIRWDAGTGRILWRRIIGTTSQLAVSRQGSFFVSAKRFLEKRRTSDGALLRRVASPGAGQLALSPDGRRLACAAGLLLIKDTTTLKTLLSVRVPNIDVHKVAYIPARKWIVCCGHLAKRTTPEKPIPSVVVLIDQTTGRSSEVSRIDEIIWCVAASPDGRYIAAGDDGGSVRVWTLRK